MRSSVSQLIFLWLIFTSFFTEMVLRQVNKCFIILVIVISCESKEDAEWGSNITKLYELVKNAAKDGPDKSQTFRRVFVNQSEYQVHIGKLKEVNGFKMHNIVIKTINPEANSTIYITNPLEAKLPHPFMTLEEFKSALIEQRIKDRKAFEKSKLLAEYSKSRAGRHNDTTKYKFTHTTKFSKLTHITATKTKKIRITNTKRITEKTTENKVENTPKAIKTKVFTRIMKARQKIQDSNKTIARENHNVKNVSTTADLRENKTLNTVQSLTDFHINNLSSDQKARSKVNLENTGNSSISSTSKYDDSKENSKTIEFEVERANVSTDSWLINTTSILRASENLLDTAEASSTVFQNKKYFNKITANIPNKNTITTVEEKSEHLGEGNSVGEKQSTEDNKRLKHYDDVKSATIKRETITGIAQTAVKATMNNNRAKSTTMIEKFTTNTEDDKELIRADQIESTTIKEDPTTSVEDQPAVESTTIEEESNDEEQTTVYIDEYKNDDETTTFTEETKTETTTTTTEPTTTTVRVKWSRPRVFNGPPPESDEKTLGQ